MRPVQLDLSGFAAFREPTSIDFDGADFFALVGPTGSGKSSIIDAICFALYGSIPRYERQGMISPIITVGALEAKVSLTFDVDDARHVATRVVRRRGADAVTAEVRLERVADGEVLAGSAREMGPAVEELLGLPFAHFTKCVVLPQGDFARFLHDKPADRQELLVELLNLRLYAKVGQRARALAAEHDAEARLDQGRLDALVATATDERKRAVETRVRACGALRAEVRDAGPALEELTKVVEAAAGEAERARRLAELLAAVAVPRDITELADRAAAAEAAFVRARKGDEEARAATEAAAAALQDRPDLASLLTLGQAHDDLAATAKELVAATAQHTARREAAAAAADALAAGQAQLDDAVAGREAIRTEHRAHMVAATLHAGDVCPVCQQVVATLPKRAKPTDIAKADTAVARAEKGRDKAAAAQQASAAAVAAAEQSVTGLQRRRAELAARVEAHPERAALDRLIEETRSAQAALDQARTLEATARRALDAARTARDEIAQTMKRAGARFAAQRDPLLVQGAEVPALRDELIDDWRALAAWASHEVGPCQERVRAEDQRRDSAAAERRALLVRVAGACAELGIEAAGELSLGALSEAVVGAEADAKHELAEVKAAIAEVKKLRKALDRASSEAEVARLLGQLLGAKGFERWLVGEALDALVLGASVTLNELSAGQYSLAFDDTSSDFLVVDHRNADERRSVRTLSGGETFQASLALALALSDQLRELAANGAARLESIFLDEGFGTLDADTLDTVASTIETLAVGDRMVGLVTHVAELSERVPVRFVVAKGPRTATVEKQLS